MTTENLFIHNCRHWEAVKAIRKRFPELDIIPPLTYEQLLTLITYKVCYLPGHDSTNETYEKGNPSSDKLLKIIL
jgi:hypothetical protein